jgi:sulfatase modifying factor 1
MNPGDHDLPPEFPPIWASAWGEDEFGIYAEFMVADVAQRCRWMPPGHFLMGLPEGEEGWPARERPKHEVTLTGFWLADTACTQALWQAVMGENPSRSHAGPMNPVETVNWDDCAGFFTKLNALVPGLDAGFPSEAQWEYACRAGTVTAYSFGESITQEQVNFGYERGRTVPVASLPANPWGLYEMHGNVWEWCSDWYGPYAAAPQMDPEGPAQGSGRVLRGGSWVFGAIDARSAFRYVYDPGGRGVSFGLRVAPGRAGTAEPVGSGR